MSTSCFKAISSGDGSIASLLGVVLAGTALRLALLRGCMRLVDCGATKLLALTTVALDTLAFVEASPARLVAPDD